MSGVENGKKDVEKDGWAKRKGDATASPSLFGTK
jgi:hypothetical protein